jgi:cytoskeletal protein CcmA (bactofilin family)
MAYREKTRLVDGLATLRATQRVQRERRYATKPPEEVVPARPPPETAKAAGGIGRTVMPTQNEIVCYACSFRFVMRGRVPSTQCPKCGARLGLTDETISGRFSDEMITAGKVTMTRDAVLDGGTVIANDILLNGTVHAGTLRALKTLTLGSGAVIADEAIDTKSLCVAEGASFHIQRPLRLLDLEVAGSLEGEFDVSGRIQVRATGHLKGTARTGHLVVEDGAGLQADLKVTPEAVVVEMPQRKTVTAGARPV